MAKSMSETTVLRKLKEKSGYAILCNRHELNGRGQYLNGLH